MNFEFLEQINWPSLAAAITGFLTAITALVVMIVNSVNNKKIKKALEDAKARQTQVVCPKCKKKSPLSEVSFVLPDGSQDNNLNGVPDHQE